jgi:hypothetical protein
MSDKTKQTPLAGLGRTVGREWADLRRQLTLNGVRAMVADLTGMEKYKIKRVKRDGKP